MCPISIFSSVNYSKNITFFLNLGSPDLKICFYFARNEDFTSTMYRSHYQERLREDLDTKIERVCVKMRNVYSYFHQFIISD